MQTTFFYLGRFLKKLADDQCYPIIKSSIYHINHNMYIQHFTTVADWLENWCLMEVSTMFYVYRYCVFTWDGRTLGMYLPVWYDSGNFQTVFIYLRLITYKRTKKITGYFFFSIDTRYEHLPHIVFNDNETFWNVIPVKPNPSGRTHMGNIRWNARRNANP